MYNQKYLQDLIDNKIEESLNLDYKASGSLDTSDRKKTEISKDVSAFANSDGGIIIYGINEDPQNKHLPLGFDPIDRNKISKEWLEQIIQSKIQPRISNFKIYPIEIDNNINDVVYLVEINKSTTAHQADDKRYYRRFNFNSVPMYDYEIKDILNRVKTPIVQLEFEIIKHTREIKSTSSFMPNYNLADSKPQYQTNYYLKVYAVNNGKILSNYVNCYVIIPAACIIEKNVEENKGKEFKYYSDNTIRDVVDVQMSGMHPITKYGPSRYDPILPGIRFKLDYEFGKLDLKCLDSDLKINWTVHADNSDAQTGEIMLKNIKKNY